MRIKRFGLLCLALITLFSCKDDDDITTYDASKDAQIYTFSVTSKTYNLLGSDTLGWVRDSLSHVKFSATKFSIDQVNGIIYNSDSLDYGFQPGMVALTVTFNTSYGISKFEIYNPDSLKYIEWNLSDSVNFSKTPLNFMVYAPYGNRKEYTLDLRIHQVDPDTIEWQNTGIYPADNPDNKVLINEDQFFAYSDNDSSIGLFTSTRQNPNEWTYRKVTGLPGGYNVLDNITIINGLFCTTTIDGDSYTSTDGMTWELRENGKYIQSIYGVIPSSVADGDVLLLAVKETDGQYYFGTTNDMADINIITEITTYPQESTINSGFPISEFTSVTNYNRGGRDNTLIIIAGLNQNEKELNSTWLVRKTGNSLEITASAKNEFFSGSGCSSFLYDDYLYVIKEGKMYYSRAWGTLWTIVPDKQQLPSDVKLGKNVSVITDIDNYIWIFSGVSEYNTWKGRLNRLN